MRHIFLKNADSSEVARSRKLISESEIFTPSSLESLLGFLQDRDKSTKEIFFLLCYPGAREVPLILSRIKTHLPQSCVVMYAYEVVPNYEIKGVLSNLRVFLSKARRGVKKALGAFKNADIDILLAGSLKNEAFYRSFHIVGENTKIIPAYGLDMENILFRKEADFTLPYPYIVYLDSSWGNCADDPTHGFKTSYTGEEYFKRIKPFFIFLEKHFNLKVVIAAHPSSGVFLHSEGVYEGFSYYRYKTYELVKNCQFCCADGSTAISYAIYLKKPLLLFYTKLLEEYEKFYSYSFRDVDISLHKKSIVVDNGTFSLTAIQEELDNFKGYQSYTDNYILYPGANTTKSIFLQLLDTLNKG